jgi:hypothetical protein
MILHCPGCRAKLRLSDEYRDKKGIWLKCPKCGERFRPQNQDLALQLGQAPKAQGPSPAGRAAVDELLNRMDLEKMGASLPEDRESALDAIPVIPEPPPKTVVFKIITAVLVLALLVGLGLVFRRAVAPTPAPQAAETPPPPDYGKDTLLWDFSAMRKDILRYRHVDRTISSSGRESRIYKYFAANMAPDYCQDITSIHLWSPRTAQGFKMVANCLDPTKEPATLEVKWDTKMAHISVAGRPLTVDLPIPRTR